MLLWANSKPLMWVWVVAELVSPGHWDHFPQARDRSCAHGEGQNQLFQVQGAGLVGGGSALLWGVGSAFLCQGHRALPGPEKGGADSARFLDFNRHGLQEPCIRMGNRYQHRPPQPQDHGARSGPWQQFRPRCHYGSRYQRRPFNYRVGSKCWQCRVMSLLKILSEIIEGHALLNFLCFRAMKISNSVCALYK